MQLASFLVLLIAVHVSVPVDCRPRLQDSEQLAQHQQGRLNVANADTSAGTGRFYSVLNGSMRHSIYSGFLGKSAYTHTTGTAYTDNALCNNKGKC